MSNLGFKVLLTLSHEKKHKRSLKTLVFLPLNEMEFSKENLKLVFVPLRCLLTLSICPKVVCVCV